MVGAGKKIYNLFTKEKSTGKERLNPRLPKEIKNQLGPMAQEIIAQDKASLREQHQRLRETKQQLKDAEKNRYRKRKSYTRD